MFSLICSKIKIYYIHKHTRIYIHMCMCVCTHMCIYDVNTEECLIGKKNESRERGGEGTGRAVRADGSKVQW